MWITTPSILSPVRVRLVPRKNPIYSGRERKGVWAFVYYEIPTAVVGMVCGIAPPPLCWLGGVLRWRKRREARRGKRRGGPTQRLRNAVPESGGFGSRNVRFPWRYPACESVKTPLSNIFTRWQRSTTRRSHFFSWFYFPLFSDPSVVVICFYFYRLFFFFFLLSRRFVLSALLPSLLSKQGKLCPEGDAQGRPAEISSRIPAFPPAASLVVWWRIRQLFRCWGDWPSFLSLSFFLSFFLCLYARQIWLLVQCA